MSTHMDFMPTAVVAMATVSYSIVGADHDHYPEHRWSDDLMSNNSFFQHDDDDNEFRETSLVDTTTLLRRFLGLEECNVVSVCLAALSCYMAVSLVNNLLEAYRFVTVWSMIVQARHMDLVLSTASSSTVASEASSMYEEHHHNNHNETMTTTHQQRCKMLRAYERLPTVPVARMCQHVHCPICLTDFFEGDFVTACDEGGCGNWFHKECLFEWLDRKDTCPCCRNDLLRPKSSSGASWLLEQVVPSSFWNGCGSSSTASSTSAPG